MVQNLKPVVELNSEDWTELLKKYKLQNVMTFHSCADAVVQNAESIGAGDMV